MSRIYVDKLGATQTTRQLKNEEIQNTPNFTDIMQVSAILEKRSLKSRNKFQKNPNDNEHFITLSSLNKKQIKYDNQKQENYHRLNRKEKLKQNQEWTELLQSENNPVKSKSSFHQLNVANKQIDAATAEINSKIKKNKNLQSNSMKLDPTLTRVNANYVNKQKLSVNLRKQHTCTNQLFPDPMNDPDFLDSELKMTNYSSDGLKIPKKFSQRRMNAMRNKKVDLTLSLVNDKLSKVTDKYFNGNYEANIKDIINKKPKYRSVKDLIKKDPVDRARLSTMEASKIMQTDLDNDLHSYGNKNTDLNKQTQQMKILYENIDFLENQVFHDNFSDEDPAKKKQNDFKTSPKSPKYDLNPSKLDDLPYDKDYESKHSKREKSNTKSAAKETMTTANNDLETAVMKSDYLKREFGLNNSPFSFRNSFKPEDKTATKANWSKDVEFLMK